MTYMQFKRGLIQVCKYLDNEDKMNQLVQISKEY